jgi:hypothetical protein
MIAGEPETHQQRCQGERQGGPRESSDGKKGCVGGMPSSRQRGASALRDFG